MGERSGLARMGREVCVEGMDRRGARACVWVRVWEVVQKQRLNNWLGSMDKKKNKFCKYEVNNLMSSYTLID